MQWSFMLGFGTNQYVSTAKCCSTDADPIIPSAGLSQATTVNMYRTRSTRALCSTLGHPNSSLHDELGLDRTETVALLDRFNTGKVRRLRTDGVLSYLGNMAFRLAGLQDNDNVAERICLRFGANSPEVLHKGQSSSTLSNHPTCCSNVAKHLAEVTLGRTIGYDAKGPSYLTADYWAQFHVIREGPFLRWKEKDAASEERCENYGKPAFEAGRNVAIITMLSWFL